MGGNGAGLRTSLGVRVCRKIRRPVFWTFYRLATLSRIPVIILGGAGPRSGLEGGGYRFNVLDSRRSVLGAFP